MVKIAPSILAADFAQLGREVTRVEAAGADLIHIDVMDGHFVPNLTIGAPVVKALRQVTTLPLDVHLMVSNPQELIPAFLEAGADIITIHAEASMHLNRAVQTIKEGGRKAGVAINPATPLTVLEEIAGEADLLLLMSVNPGFGGQKFIASSISKIARLRQRLTQERFSAAIEVDGGINPETAPLVVAAGADILVAGSAIYGSDDLGAAIAALRRENG